MKKKQTFKPNTVLPKGANLFNKPFRQKIGGWNELEFDADLTRNGVTWLRVRSGFGSKKHREHWVAGIPYGCVCVHDYDFAIVEGFGNPEFKTLEEAMDSEIVKGLEYNQQRLQEKLDELNKLARAGAMLAHAVAESKSLNNQK